MSGKGDVVLVTGTVRKKIYQHYIIKVKIWAREANSWKRLLIVGGSGFLGQHIIKLLQEKDDDVKEIRIIDLQPYKNKLGKFQ